mmetsp:Transcript_17920/g.29976  ORF Transcript_17920/g.29976 Transcript_17920/m.29976 type:complete len:236 (-) Transcript_17920:89-796(-)
MKRKLIDLDAQIAALEAASGGNEDESSTDSSTSDSDSDNDNDNGNTRIGKARTEKHNAVTSSSGIVETVDAKGEVQILKSIISDEAPIAPLASQHLPAAGCGVTTQKEKKKSKKQKKIPPTAEEIDKSGLEKTVMEMLRNYQPSSSEKRPFWCRVCRFQGSSEEDLMTHRGSELHQIASQKERKMSFCKLCKIQFTSPDQLKEHLRGSKHKARLDKAIQNQGRTKNPHGQKYERI